MSFNYCDGQTINVSSVLVVFDTRHSSASYQLAKLRCLVGAGCRYACVCLSITVSGFKWLAPHQTAWPSKCLIDIYRLIEGIAYCRCIHINIDSIHQSTSHWGIHNLWCSVSNSLFFQSSNDCNVHTDRDTRAHTVTAGIYLCSNNSPSAVAAVVFVQFVLVDWNNACSSIAALFVFVVWLFLQSIVHLSNCLHSARFVP